MFDEELKLTELTKTSLLKAMKWLKFFAVLGVIGIIIILAFAVFFLVTPAAFQTAELASASWIVAALYVVIALIYIYPVKKAFSIVSNTRKAIETNDQMILEKTAADFHALLKFCGIITIIVLVLYVLIIIGAATVGLHMF